MHPSGLMCRTYPQKAIEVMLAQLSEVSLVRDSPTPGEVLASRMKDICSVTLSESLMKLECPQCFSKTCRDSSHPMMMWTTGQATLFGMHQQETYSDSFPKAGLMRDGQIWGLKTLVPRTGDTVGGVAHGANFPTPNAFDSVDDFGYRKASNRDEGGMHCVSLRHMIKEMVDWQTPSSVNFRTRGGDRSDELGLDNQVKQNWATPVESPAGGTAEAFLDRKRKSVDSGNAMGVSLTDLGMQVAEWQKPRMVPTRKGDQMRQETSREYWERMNTRPDLEGPKGEPWPTPQEHDKAAGNAERVGRFGTDAGGRNLTDEVVHPNNWSTPKVVTGDYTRDGGEKGQERLTLSGEVTAWSTPRGSDGPHGGPNMRDSSGSVALPAQVLAGDNWNTPLASDSTTRGFNDDGKAGEPIHHQVGRWATPTKSDTTGPGAHGEGGLNLSTKVEAKPWATPAESDDKGSVTLEKAEERSKQRLNPDWEELLMSWQIGWTDITKPCGALFPGFPMGQGPNQFDYEPSRTIHRDDSPNRTKRVSAIGNGVVTVCVAEAYYLLLTEPIR